MHPLAVAGAKRLPALPAVPTLEETGVPVVVDSFWGLVAPAGTSTAIVARLQENIARVLNAPDMRARIEDMQFQVVGNTPAQFDTFVQSEVKRWTAVVKATGVKVE
jgi:tripartite-type tricarboxylate transporter receptor subunit TctC